MDSQEGALEGMFYVSQYTVSSQRRITRARVRFVKKEKGTAKQDAANRDLNYNRWPTIEAIEALVVMAHHDTKQHGRAQRGVARGYTIKRDVPPGSTIASFHLPSYRHQSSDGA